MDASSLASAALALAVANSQTAALQELLLERERLAMRGEDMRSFFVAARHFTRDLLLQRGSVPPADVPWTWERAHEQRNSDLGYAHALRDVRMGESESAEQRLNYEVGESSAEEEENMEESDC